MNNEEILNLLSVLAIFLSLFLISSGISDVIELDDQKTDERREAYRKEAFAQKNADKKKKQNRKDLWYSVSKLGGEL